MESGYQVPLKARGKRYILNSTLTIGLASAAGEALSDVLSARPLDWSQLAFWFVWGSLLGFMVAVLSPPAQFRRWSWIRARGRDRYLLASTFIMAITVSLGFALMRVFGLQPVQWPDLEFPFVLGCLLGCVLAMFTWRRNERSSP